MHHDVDRESCERSQSSDDQDRRPDCFHDVDHVREEVAVGHRDTLDRVRRIETPSGSVGVSVGDSLLCDVVHDRAAARLHEGVVASARQEGGAYARSPAWFFVVPAFMATLGGLRGGRQWRRGHCEPAIKASSGFSPSPSPSALLPREMGDCEML
jgi:hypothetical protein